MVEDLITLDHICPHPLKADHPEAIWNKLTELECGKFYQVISPSGSGKSTLIGILNGIRHDYSGSLLYGGIPFTHAPQEKWVALRNSRLSCVYQDLRLFEGLTALENISILNAFRNSGSDFPVNQWSDLLGIADKLNTPVGKLSYGQKQRVAIIRALNREFKWMILDEPFSHLDNQNITLALKLIVEECESRKAGILMTGLDKRFVQDDFLSLII